MGAMSLLAWNCRGSDGSLRSSKMTHLARLLTSTNAQVCFISETRNSTIKRTALANRFNYFDAFVVPAQGQSGGLWLIWNNDVDLAVVDHYHHYSMAMCINKQSMKQFGLICIYGDPHHRATDDIWSGSAQFCSK